MTNVLDYDLVDDLEVSVDAETYQDRLNPAPPPTGNYRVKILKWGLAEYEGKLTLDANAKGERTLPRLKVEQIEILEPFPYVDRKVMLYQDFKFRSFDRAGENASEFADLLRGLNQEVSFRGTKEGLKVFADNVDNNSLVVTLDWTAYDGEYVRERFNTLFGKDSYTDLTPDERRQAGEIYKKARVNGMKNFRLPTGKISHVITGPSGDKIEARSKIVAVFPSLASVKIGVREVV
jgi:hypothetical protein